MPVSRQISSGTVHTMRAMNADNIFFVHLILAFLHLGHELFHVIISWDFFSSATHFEMFDFWLSFAFELIVPISIRQIKDEPQMNIMLHLVVIRYLFLRQVLWSIVHVSSRSLERDNLLSAW